MLVPGSGITTSTPWHFATPTRRWPAIKFAFMLDHQQPDGMIPDAVYDEGTITHLQIPVAAAMASHQSSALVAIMLFDQSGDGLSCAICMASHWCAGIRGGLA
ncbi:MAG: hypothetical protein U0074_05580 [Kouleothrix sp.]